ncbi:MAG TPA: 5'/3'-nucleotidase SurE [Candidatus Limnocylindria bacterium]|nr:5'/3'-nucleotidase SurE [Candidatus Limnocylindria bacterium]
MRILVANDDGIHSPGIAMLARVATQFGDVRVVAPDVEQSSASHAITSSRPLSYRAATNLPGIEAYRVNGTPADCVALGVHNWKDVDLVLSGVNIGVNLGNGMWHSGTLAAAKQATLFGLRGIALSTPSARRGGGEPDFDALAPHVADVLGRLLPLTDARLLNVNLPPSPRGMMWTRQAVRHYDGKIVPDEDPMGRRHFWFTVVPIDETERGTDLWAMERGYISVTPLSVDLTDHAALEHLSRDHPLAEPSAEEEQAESVEEDE